MSPSLAVLASTAIALVALVVHRTGRDLINPNIAPCLATVTLVIGGLAGWWGGIAAVLGGESADSSTSLRLVLVGVVSMLPVILTRTTMGEVQRTLVAQLLTGVAALAAVGLGVAFVLTVVDVGIEVTLNAGGRNTGGRNTVADPLLPWALAGSTIATFVVARVLDRPLPAFNPQA